MLVTVRLFPQIHGALIEELGKASRGLRAARAICLMTVGMTHERGHGWRAGPGVVAQAPPTANLASDPSTNSENEAFVSALLGEQGP